MFNKVRLVSAGFKIYKTAISDNEQGILYTHYNPAGIPVATGSSLGGNLGREDKDKAKVYLAGLGNKCCEKRSGFVEMCTYHPTLGDEVTRYHTNQHSVVEPVIPLPDGEEFAEADVEILQKSSYHWAVLDANGNYTARSFEEVMSPTASATEVICLIADDLKQRHSFIVMFDGAGTTQFEFEFAQNWEGPPDKDDKGIGVKEVELSIDYLTPIHLFRLTDPSTLFCSNDRKMEAYFRS